MYESRFAYSNPSGCVLEVSGFLFNRNARWALGQSGTICTVGRTAKENIVGSQAAEVGKPRGDCC